MDYTDLCENEDSSEISHVMNNELRYLTDLNIGNKLSLNESKTNC